MKILPSGLLWLLAAMLPGILCTTIEKNIQGQVVCFGDSITYGGQVDGHSWVWYLQEDHKKGREFINAGRSGRKTSDREELLPVLEKYPHAAYYLFFLGVNDLKDGTDSLVSSCVENMKWMIARTRRVNPEAKVVILAPTDINLLTMNDINRKKNYNQNTKNCLAALETHYRQLAKEEGIGFISLLDTVSPDNYTDGLHPDLKGQEQIADAVREELGKL